MPVQKLFKINLLGDEETGKSQILNRYVQDKFREKYQATIGADFFSKSVNNGNSTLQLWDAAGQERFASLGQAFLRGSDAVVLVASYDKEKSLPALKGFAKQAKESAPNAQILVVINKADLEPSKRKFTESDVTSVIKTELSDICNLLEEEPISISAKSDAEANGSNFTSISKVFGDLAETLATLKNDKDDIVIMPQMKKSVKSSVAQSLHIDPETKKDEKKKPKKHTKTAKRNFFGFKV